MNTVTLPKSTDSRRFYLVLGALILVAWGILFLWQSSGYEEFLSHEVIGDDTYPPLLHLSAFILSWFLMTIAMMLPGSLLMLNQSVQPLRRRMSGSLPVGLTVLGYLLPWALFGLLVFLGDTVLHLIAAPAAPLAEFSGSIAPAIVLTAGLYQLTPVKREYMKRCQPSHTSAQPGCVEAPDNISALKQGLQLGVNCVGSCWSMMLLMFAVGHNRLDWMLALSGVMAAERLTPWGRRLAWFVGLALIAWATLWMLGSLHGAHLH